MQINYRKILAENVRGLMDATPHLNSAVKVAKACRGHSTRKIGARTITHLTNPEGPQPQLDTIIAVAAAFKLELTLLFRSGLDPRRPLPSARVFALAERLAAVSTQALEEFGRAVGLPLEGIAPQTSDSTAAHKLHDAMTPPYRRQTAKAEAKK